MLLIKNANIITMDKERKRWTDGAVLVDGTEIADIGDSQVLSKKYPDAEVFDASGKIIIPGLINAHTHIFQILYRGLGDDVPLLDWLKKCIWPMSLNLTAEDCYWAAMLSAVEMLKCGTTTFVDSHYINLDLRCQDKIAEAVIESGIRGILGRGTVNGAGAPEAARESVEQAVDEACRVIETYNGAAEGRLAVRVEPLNEALATADMIKAMSDVARRYNTGMNMHISEALPRVEQFKKDHGVSPIKYLSELGVLGPELLLAHCCWIDDEDIDLLAESNTAVAHNPVSNQFLADGVCPVPKLLAKGVRVTMGPDGAASNNNNNMFQVIKAAPLLHKLSNLKATALTAEKSFEMVTVDAAAALNMSDRIGSLEIGKKADLVVIDPLCSVMVPSFNLISNLVYAGDNELVESVMVNGEFVMKDKKILTFDEAEILKQADKAAWKLAKISNVMNLVGKN
ncbi:MAG: amidohydrolase family protein [Bacillota bacterium]|jgi:5-methylthioadenosine/S-adenosylhomocysteine deaminase